MKLWRKVVGMDWSPTGWTLRLKCGHEAYRSSPYSRQELPGQVLCKSCDFLIGSQVEDRLGTRGRVTGYRDGLFAIAWNKGGLTHATLDELREKAEIMIAA
jgi:hypothetical protein